VRKLVMSQMLLCAFSVSKEGVEGRYIGDEVARSPVVCVLRAGRRSRGLGIRGEVSFHFLFDGGGWRCARCADGVGACSLTWPQSSHFVTPFFEMHALSVDVLGPSPIDSSREEGVVAVPFLPLGDPIPCLVLDCRRSLFVCCCHRSCFDSGSGFGSGSGFVFRCSWFCFSMVLVLFFDVPVHVSLRFLFL